MGVIPALPNFAQAAPHLGAPSAKALHQRFARGIYPKRFLVSLTDRLQGVDLHALLNWIKAGRPKEEAPPQDIQVAPTSGAERR